MRAASRSMRSIPRAIFLGGGGALAVERGVAADGGEWGAELVRGIGDEAAHGRFGLGFGGHGLIDAVEHGVECRAEVPDLAGRVWCGGAGGQFAAGDASGGVDVVKRD